MLHETFVSRVYHADDSFRYSPLGCLLAKHFCSVMSSLTAMRKNFNVANLKALNVLSFRLFGNINSKKHLNKPEIGKELLLSFVKRLGGLMHCWIGITDSKRRQNSENPKIVFKSSFCHNYVCLIANDSVFLSLFSSMRRIEMPELALSRKIESKDWSVWSRFGCECELFFELFLEDFSSFSNRVEIFSCVKRLIRFLTIRALDTSASTCYLVMFIM